MAKTKKSPYSILVDGLWHCGRKSAKHSWQPVVFENILPVVKAWKSLSSRQKIKVVKDHRWNNYPLLSYTSTSPKRFGHAIEKLVTKILAADESDIMILRRHAIGIFAVFTMDRSISSVRISMAKRLRHSKDKRIKSRCARILPIRYMNDLLKSKDASVRSIAIRRLGIDNCYKNFLPAVDSSGTHIITPMGTRRWEANTAVRLSNLDEVSDLIPLLNSRSLNLNMTASLLEKLSKEDILYYLDVAGLSKRGRRIIRAKLEGLK